MSLRPLIDLAAENERVHALAGRVLAAADGGEGVSLRASTTLRPLLLAALLEDDRGLAGRPALLVAADDRAARDLAADLRAYLAPRRVRLYPSRGTGYASSVTPPPHLVGLRIDALDALSREADAVVVASAVALAEAVPDASLRPAGFEIAKGDEIDLGAVAGSGPQGRIVRADVEAAAGRAGAAAPASAPSPAFDPAPADEIVPLSGVRRAIARTLTQAWQTIPHVIDYREVDATALLTTRRELRARAERDGEEELARALTVTPLVVKICALTLRRHRHVNASIDLEREQILLRGAINIGIATAAPDGLMVPVVHDADRRTVAEIAVEVAALGAAARDRTLTPAQLAGGTFTVNNYGGLGIWLGTPIIPPPQVANFGLGRIEERPVVRDGEVVVRPILPLAVSGDHRLLDGHTLAAFVSDTIELLSAPSLLLAELR
ncbi:MAG: 2-oxo acid dehydrogenase subunit E2 [Actinobacteria bacterium]|nr:2-oxo acid dehydrogenase subunit E2 [Actinomycetota bacterium]